MTLLDVDLNDKYDLSKTRVFITGTQALIRMCLLQSRLDRKAGLNTAGYVTGYRGSPLGGLDSQFPRARRQLTQAQVTYAPALNEDLAATALWGAQQAEMRGEGKYDGVFGIWYGKGPGVDRSGDVFRHANLAGTSRHGGVLALMGDDHTCESSTTCHQSEYALMDAMMPILNPATIGEIIDYGLHGWAMSRYAGVWVGLKCVKDNVESTASILSDPDAFQSVLPVGHVLPDGGLNIRTNDSPQEQEARLHRHKLDAAKAYVRANGLNRVVLKGGAKPRIGIVSTGKSYMDVLSALELLNIDEAKADQLGLSLFKVAMPWPLEPEGLAEFALGLDQLIVVEEKRGLMEDQIRTLLYGRKEAPRSIIGKKDENGTTLFQSELALNPMQIAEAIGRRLGTANRSVAATAEAIHAKLTEERSQFAVQRKPYFCAGCPHSSSTVLPEGARGYAGIGCHWMSQMMERRVEGYTHMGGEGANWIGESHFSARRHMFQNMGDGTYNHSGLMSIRAAVAAKTPVTFKILFNDTVAMTGGQDHDGELTPQRIAAEVKAAGVERLAFMSDRPDLYTAADFPVGTSIDHRDDIIRVQKDLSEINDVTVLLYEQTCAAEKRRRRKRGKLEEPDRRIFINSLVCEGCGDCGQKSNCVAVLPLDTEFGRKRQIDQTSCNKDFSCVKGFCPSFVSVIGGTLRKPSASTAPLPQVPEPTSTSKLDKPYAIALTGVGGTGVVTIASLLGMAAHLEGKGSALIDMAGMAQKGGAVTSHIMLAQSPADIKAIRIAPGQANLLLGCDLVVSASDTLLKMLGPQSRLVVNTHETMTGDFTRNPDFTLHPKSLVERLAASVPNGASTFLDSSQIARNLMGDTIAANLFMLGVAYQQGLVPVSSPAILKAIELNGVSIDFNKRSFEWGRLWAHDRSFVENQANLKPVPQQTLSLDELISSRSADLSAYQNKAYAERYRHLVEQVRLADPHPEKLLTHAVARNGYKLMAYKDEYEVARLFTDGRFLDELGRQFTGDFKLRFHMAPPLLGDRDPVTGSPQKRTFGRWLLAAMRPLAKFRALRGTAFDPFGKTSERRSERALMEDYLETMPIAARADLDDKAYDKAVQLASIPEKIRGFGHVKEDSIKSAAALRGTLLKSLKSTRWHRKSKSEAVSFNLLPIAHFGRRPIMTGTQPEPSINLTGMAYTTDAGIGRRANIGLLVLQTDLTIEEEYRRILPEGVALYHSRLLSPAQITVENLRKMEAEIPVAAGLLPNIPFASIGFGCTSGALVIGEPVVAERVHQIRPEAAATDPVTAAVAALKALKASRTALLTPYLPEINASLRRQLLERGLNIPVMGSFNQPDDYTVAKISTDAIKEAIIKLGRSDEVNSVFVSCTSLRVASIAAEVEAIIGKPVTSSNHAMAWHMLRLAGIHDLMPQHGRLFEVN